MEPISQVEPIGSRAFTWQGYEPAVKCDLTSTAVEVGGTLVFVDPVALTERALETLLVGRAPSAILLTNANHQRDSLALRARLGIPIVAPTAARGEIIADFWIDQTDSVLVYGLRPIPLPGAGLGEVAYHLESDEPCVIFGDAVINLPPEGLRLLPAKYCEDAGLLGKSMKFLANLDVQSLHFAHGRPLIHRAAEALQSLIDSAVK
jgi:hypothetical protein